MPNEGLPHCCSRRSAGYSDHSFGYLTNTAHRKPDRLEPADCISPGDLSGRQIRPSRIPCMWKAPYKFSRPLSLRPSNLAGHTSEAPVRPWAANHPGAGRRPSSRTIDTASSRPCRSGQSPGRWTEAACIFDPNPSRLCN
ncbi:hypothetical protein D3C81_1221120 [compost metagenome]